MGRQSYFIMGFLVGLVVVLSCLLLLRNEANYAYAQTADSGTGPALIIGTGGVIQNYTDLLWVIYKRKPSGKEVFLVPKEERDQERVTLAAYRIEQGGITGARVKHLASRDITYDLKVWGLDKETTDSYAKIRNEVLKFQKDEEDKEKKQQQQQQPK